MSRIDDMIKELCQEGVEIHPLGNTCEILRGKRVTKSNIKPQGTYPVISGGITPMGFMEDYNREANTITVSQYGTAGYVDFQTKKFWANDICYCLYPNKELNNRFLWYVLKEKQNYLYEIRNTDATPFSLPSETLKGVEIPLPPLAIQQEIISVLDSFTTLIDKMKQEVEARKKQMEYYREKLLTFEEGECEWKTLGDIGEVRMCKRILKSQTSSTGDIPFYKIGTFGKNADAFISNELFEEYKSKYNYPKSGDILISAAGTIGRCVTFDGTPSYFQDSNIVWIENNEEQVTNKYLKWFYSIAKWNIQNGGSVARLYNDNLKSTDIPIPSLNIQAEIVSTLDKFESYITKLEKLIALRQKQYEYYRERLLTF